VKKSQSNSRYKSEYNIWQQVWPYIDPPNHLGDTSKYRPRTTHNIYGCRYQLPSSSRNKSIYFLIHDLLSSRYQYNLLIWRGYNYKDKETTNLRKEDLRRS